MSAYIIVESNVTNPEQFAEYAKRAPAAVEKFGGKYLVRGGDVVPYEGGWEPPRITVVEFESMEKAKAAFESPEYLEAKKHREGAAEFKVVFVQGV